MSELQPNSVISGKQISKSCSLATFFSPIPIHIYSLHQIYEYGTVNPPPLSSTLEVADGKNRPRQIITCNSWTQPAATASGKLSLNGAEKCRNMLLGENVTFYFLSAVNIYSPY